MLIVSVTLAYAAVKFIDLKENTNPVVNDVTIPNFFDMNRIESLDDVDFKRSRK